MSQGKDLTITLVNDIMMDRKGRDVSFHELDLEGRYDLRIDHVPSGFIHRLIRNLEARKIPEITGRDFYSSGKFYAKLVGGGI